MLVCSIPSALPIFEIANKDFGPIHIHFSHGGIHYEISGWAMIQETFVLGLAKLLIEVDYSALM